MGAREIDKRTAKQRNRAIRQEALREQLAQQGHVQKAIEIARKLANDPGLETVDVQRLKAASDIHLRLVAKYLPDVKSIELTGDGGGPVEVGPVMVVPAVQDTKSWGNGRIEVDPDDEPAGD